MKIIHNIDLDVSRHGVQASIPITKGDVGIHRLVITLRNKGESIKLSERDQATMYFDTDQFHPITVYLNTGEYSNSLVYDVTASASATEGAKTATVQLISSALGMIMVSANIVFNVCDNKTYQSAVLESPPYAAVVKAALVAEHNAYVAEAAKEAAESARDEAKEYKEEAKEYKEEAKEYKEEAERAAIETKEYVDKEILGGKY